MSETAEQGKNPQSVDDDVAMAYGFKVADKLIKDGRVEVHFCKAQVAGIVAGAFLAGLSEGRKDSGHE